MNLDDAEILKRVCDGQLELFDELVLRYRGPLLRVAENKLGNAAWAEDVVQEAFLAAYAARETFNPQFSFRTWLWTILLNLCRRQLRRRSNRPREWSNSESGTPSLQIAEPATDETGLSRALLAESRQQLISLLCELPEVQADALRLRFFGGLKYDEIARAMNSSVSAAKVRVRNGLIRMADQLRDEDGEVQ